MPSKQLFSEWFSLAISEWPKSVDLKLLYSQDEGQKYVVEGLGRLADRIGDLYIGREDELVFRNLHWALNIAIHDLAKYVTTVCMADLRQDAVQIIFDDNLRACVNDLRTEGDEVPALLCEYLNGESSST